MSKSKSLNIDFSKGKEEGYRRVYGQSPLLTNPGDCWDGVYLAYDYQPANETPEVFAPQIGLTIFTEVSENICYEQTINGRFYKKQIVPGDIVITPANIGTRARLDKSLNVIFIGFEPILFNRTIYESLDTDKIELVPQFAISDPLIYQIGLSLKSSLEILSKGIGNDDSGVGKNFFKSLEGLCQSSTLIRSKSIFSLANGLIYGCNLFLLICFITLEINKFG